MKKLLSVCGALLLSASLLFGVAACGGGEGDGSGTINIYCVASGVSDDQLNADPIAEKIREYTGEDIYWKNQPTAAGDVTSQLNSIFINRMEGFDLISMSKDNFLTFLAQDAFFDISPYLETMENDPFELIGELGWDMTRDGDAIYGIPVKNAREMNNDALAYRTDYLAAYNADTANTDKIPVPSEENGYSMTVSDFTDFLKWIKAKIDAEGSIECDVEGCTLDHTVTHPFIVPTNTPIITNIATAFGIYQNWADSNGDGKLEFYTEQVGFADYMKYMNYLYANDLLFYETNTANSVANALVIQEGGEAGTASGSVAHWSTVPYEGSSTTEANDHYGYISALIPDDFDKAEGANENEKRQNSVRVFSAESYGTFFAIPAFTPAAKVERIIKMIDKMLDDDFFRESYIGTDAATDTENGTYTVKDGQYWPTDKFSTAMVNADKLVVALREAETAEYWMCRVRKTFGQQKQFTVGNYKISEITGIKDPTTARGLSEVYDNNQSPRVTNLQSYMTAQMYPQENKTTLITDTAINAVKARYATDAIEGIEASGTEITADLNEWYASWSGKDGYTHAVRTFNQTFAALNLA